LRPRPRSVERRQDSTVERPQQTFERQRNGTSVVHDDDVSDARRALRVGVELTGSE